MKYYFEARKFDKAISCQIQIQDFEGMKNVLNELNEGSPLLSVLAKQFQLFGIHKCAITCFLKLDDIKSAIDTCILLNRWEDAIDLAEQGDFPQIDGLISKYAAKLLGDGGNRFRAIELYQRSGKLVEAAKLLSDMAQEVYGSSDGVNILTTKKLHVVAANQVETHRDITMDLNEMSTKSGRGSTAAATTAATINTLISTEAEVRGRGLSSRILDNAWEGASAMHYFSLAHKQLWRGDPYSAMITALRCTQYEHILNPLDLYSFIALSSYFSENFTVCSKAFTKLENLSQIDEILKCKIEKLVRSKSMTFRFICFSNKLVLRSSMRGLAFLIVFFFSESSCFFIVFHSLMYFSHGRYL